METKEELEQLNAKEIAEQVSFLTRHRDEMIIIKKRLMPYFGETINFGNVIVRLNHEITIRQNILSIKDKNFFEK